MNEEDKVIQKLFDKAKQKRAAIDKVKRAEYKTNQIFSWDDTLRNTSNLNIMSIRELTNVLSKLCCERNNWNEANKLLCINTKFEWCNHSFEDWLHDIKNKVDNLNIRTKVKELNVLEAKLDKLISPEMKRKLEIEAISKELE
jgi:hypothetical protein